MRGEDRGFVLTRQSGTGLSERDWCRSSLNLGQVWELEERARSLAPGLLHPRRGPRSRRAVEYMSRERGDRTRLYSIRPPRRGRASPGRLRQTFSSTKLPSRLRARAAAASSTPSLVLIDQLRGADRRVVPADGGNLGRLAHRRSELFLRCGHSGCGASSECRGPPRKRRSARSPGLPRPTCLTGYTEICRR